MQNFKKFLMEASDSTQVKDLQSDGFFFSVKLDGIYGRPFTIIDYGKAFMFRCPLDDFGGSKTYGRNRETVTAIEITFNRKGSIIDKTVCTNEDAYTLTTVPKSLRIAFNGLSRQLKPFIKSLVTFGAESNFYKAICKFNRNPWADEDYKFHSEKPDDDTADYMLRNGELPK